MSIPNGTAVQVTEREPEALPFVGRLLSRFMDLDFEPRPCRAAVDEVMLDPRSGATPGLLRPEAIAEGGLLATEELLYPAARRSLRILEFADDAFTCSWRARVSFDHTTAPEIAELLGLLIRGADPGELRARAPWLGEPVHSALARVSASAAPGFPRIDAPGIYRREHGCAVIHSRTTSLMLDPVSFWMPHAPRAPLELEGGLDAILITHGHADHWDIAAILAHATPRTRVIVPRVERASILSPNDMVGALRLFGREALAPAWGSSLVVGDIEVDVLPFYGEQPVRDGAGPAAGLRNWGNCYRFTTPEFSAMAIIDSGTDPSGSMAEVARTSCAARGPLDVVLSSLPHFHCPFFLGLPHYYLALPFDRLRELHEQYRRGALPSVTPGPAGIAEVCAAAQARYYLPYGNGFAGVGRPIADVGIHIGEPAEADVVRHLGDLLAGRGVRTLPIAWNPGDRVTFDGGRAVRRAAGEVGA